MYATRCFTVVWDVLQLVLKPFVAIRRRNFAVYLLCLLQIHCKCLWKFVSAINNLAGSLRILSKKKCKKVSQDDITTISFQRKYKLAKFLSFLTRPKFIKRVRHVARAVITYCLWFCFLVTSKRLRTFFLFLKQYCRICT